MGRKDSGVDKYISQENFKTGKARARKYRNRRIGELFKEIDLSEKQGTGITKILRELKKNGSPEPLFDMDEDRNYLETTIFIREGFKTTKMSEKVSEKMSEKMSEKNRKDSWANNLDYKVMVDQNSFLIEVNRTAKRIS